MKVYELLVDAVGAEGVGAVFAVMGDGNMRWLSLLGDIDSARVYYARSEGAAVAMADGYARVTGSVGVAAVTAGPGLTQVPTSLITAARASTPLVLLAGDTPPTQAGSIQFLNQRRFVEGMEIASRSLRSVDTAAEDVREAFHSARARLQPVVLNIPMDLQDVELESEVRYEPLTTDPLRRMRPDADAVRAAADLLTSSSRPIIICGRGTSRSNAGPAVIALADRIGALLSTTLQAKGLFAGDPWDVGVAGHFGTRSAEALFADCDCVLAVGASLNQYTSERGLLFPRARTIQVDTCVSTTALTSGVVDCFVQGDARAAVTEIDREMQTRRRSAAGWRTERIADRLAENPAGATDAPTLHDGAVDPRAVMRALNEAVVDEPVIFVVGVGHFWWFALYHLDGGRTRTFVLPTDFGAIGQALPTAIGVAVGSGGRKVVVIEGDVSLMMQIQEIDTAARYGLPITVIAMNDDGLGAEYHKLKGQGLVGDHALIHAPSFAAVAASLGAEGGTASDLAQARSLLDTALRVEVPFVIDAKVARDVVSAPYRRLYYGEVKA